MDKRDLENKDYNQDIVIKNQSIQEQHISSEDEDVRDFVLVQSAGVQNESMETLLHTEEDENEININSDFDFVECGGDAYYIEGEKNIQLNDSNIDEFGHDTRADDKEPQEYIFLNEERKSVSHKSMRESELRKRKKSGNFVAVAALILICSLVFGMSIGFGYKMGENYFASKDSNANQQPGGIISETENTASNQGQAQIADVINNPLNGSVSLADLAENTKKAVVAITSHEITRNYLMGTVETPTSGTGIVYQMSKDKIFIVTNSHVVGEGKTSVKFEHQSEPVDVEFIGRDEVTDVAVLSVKKSDLNKEALSYIKPIKFANSDKVRVGDFIMVVGNPLGYDYTTTFGIVSGLNRNTQLTSEDLLIQVDAAVNRGNSGGPLVNMSGELIGIINQKMNQMTAEGIGFAIPSNRVMEDVKFLVENKENPSSSQAFLGITGEAIDESAAQYYRLPLGVLVRSTMENSPAKAAGIKEADIIVEADGKKITNMVELQRVISRKKPSDEIVVKILRVQEGELNIKVTLGDKSKFNLKY